MLRYLVLILFISSCATNFQVRPISDEGPRQIQATKEQEAGFDRALREGLAQRYKKAKEPSFALISGFYRLPEAKPYGSAQLVHGYSYQTHLESVRVGKKDAPFVISPLSGEEAAALNKSMNILLDMGVRIHEITMSDALKIAQAEKSALKAHKDIFWSEILGPSVDYLVSVDKAHSAQGPALVGRVISRDGRLLAFRVMQSSSSSAQIGTMILALFEDTINRL